MEKGITETSSITPTLQPKVSQSFEIVDEFEEKVSIDSSINLDEINKVSEVATELIGQQDTYYDKIEAFVKQYVYHLGTSAKVGANYIKVRLKQIYGE